MYKRIVTGGFVNTYFIYNNKDVIFVDPGYDFHLLQKELEDNDIKKPDSVNIFITHGHYDHIYAVDDFIDNYSENKLRIYIHKDEVKLLTHSELNGSIREKKKCRIFRAKKYLVTLSDGDIINVCNRTFRIIHTPGHTPGSIFYVDDENKIVFAGDTILKDNFGPFKTDSGIHFPMANPSLTLQVIKRVVPSIPDDYKLLAGHLEESTFGYEKENNIYVKNADYYINNTDKIKLKKNIEGRRPGSKIAVDIILFLQRMHVTQFILFLMYIYYSIF